MMDRLSRPLGQQAVQATGPPVPYKRKVEFEGSQSEPKSKSIPDLEHFQGKNLTFPADFTFIRQIPSLFRQISRLSGKFLHFSGRFHVFPANTFTFPADFTFIRQIPSLFRQISRLSS